MDNEGRAERTEEIEPVAFTPRRDPLAAGPERLDDELDLTGAAVEARVPCLTSLDTALAVVTALRASEITTNVAPLAEYRALEPVATTAAD